MALGYLGRESFGKIYQTGDRAEYQENGELLYRGRIDNMVKISGYRIEPEEIESVLCQYPDVLAARVRAEGERLSAYCAVKDKNAADLQSALRAYLQRHLPGYMIPSTMVFVDELPVDERTGKISLAAVGG